MEADILDSESAGRQDGGAKLRQITEGARSVFLNAGFDGASMNDIARAAQVSKGTLYAYFDSKERLFEAIIRAEFEQAAERFFVFKREGDVRSTLIAFGIRLMNRMTRPETLALARVVVAATEKFPAIGRAFYEAGPLFGATRLADELAALTRSGELAIDDPERAAWQLVDLCQSYVHKRVLFGVVERATPEEIEAAVKAGVDVFLAAYAPRR